MMSNSDSGLTTTREGMAQQGSTEPRSPAQIEADLEQTRHELGETVDALSAKLDVKSRAKDQLADTKQRAAEQALIARGRASQALAQGKEAATDQDGSLKPAVPTAGGIALLVLGAVVVLVIRRRGRRVTLKVPRR